MNQRTDLFDRATEPADRFHPDYESFKDWLDTEAPADQAQKLRNAATTKVKVKKPQPARVTA